MREEVKGSFCTIMVSKKDPNQDITERFAWENCERRPNWIPKVCQLQTAVFRPLWNGEEKKIQHAVNFEWSFHTHDIVLAIMVVSNLKTLESRCDIQCTVRKFTSYRPTSQGKLLALKVTVPSSASRCELETRVKPSGTSPSHSSSYTGSHMPIEAILVTSLDLLAPTYDGSCVRLSSQMGLINSRGTSQSSLSASARRVLAILQWLARPSGNKVRQLSLVRRTRYILKYRMTTNF